MIPTQLGLVLHPRRPIAEALDTIRGWAERHGAAVGQVLVEGQPERIADPVDTEACDLVLAVGGDGTTLAALHAAAPASRPVLGVACGSIGVLTAVAADQVSGALDQVAAGNWRHEELPGLEIVADGEALRVAINDFTVVRDGTGQVITGITVDGELYARTAGDGLVVATRLGSSAYTMAAGGPILAPGAHAMVITPLANHGGVTPPLVVGADSRVALSIEPGYGGSRFEVDGQVVPTQVGEVTFSLCPGYATMVALADQEPLLARLRRRGLVVDGPRVLVRDARTSPAQ